MASGGTLGIQANGQTIVVNITDEAGHAASAKVAGSPISFPYTLASDTSIVIANGANYLVSATINGVETVGKQMSFRGGDSEIIAPSITTAQLGAGASGQVLGPAALATTVTTTIPALSHATSQTVPAGSLDLGLAQTVTGNGRAVEVQFGGLMSMGKGTGTTGNTGICDVMLVDANAPTVVLRNIVFQKALQATSTEAQPVWDRYFDTGLSAGASRTYKLFACKRTNGADSNCAPGIYGSDFGQFGFTLAARLG